MNNCLFIYDENLNIVAFQTFPETTEKSHIKVKDSQIMMKLMEVVGHVKLNQDLTLSDDFYEVGLINKNQSELEEILWIKTKELHANADKAGEAYLKRYSDIERETFGIQKDEAKAWQEDNAAATPFIDSLAQKRGIDRITMIQKVIDAMQALQDMSMAIVSEQQSKEDQIKAAYNLKDNYTDPSNQLAEIQHAIETLEALDVSITPVA